MGYNLKDLKIGSIISKEDLKEIGNVMEGDGEVIRMSYELYNRKSGVSATIKLSCKDYEELGLEDK